MEEVLGRVQLNSKEAVDSSLLHAAVPVGFNRLMFLPQWKKVIELELEPSSRKGFSSGERKSLKVLASNGKSEGITWSNLYVHTINIINKWRKELSSVLLMSGHCSQTSLKWGNGLYLNYWSLQTCKVLQWFTGHQVPPGTFSEGKVAVENTYFKI